ncbi:hypothetical protein GCM10009716_04330 [Streptomyces sodiiphilus]|uniref:MFS transporter n=1 Tax=Streptomyces sodiiphilus TaxID=226217 RepID=A0ABP5A318_9ACTN
MLFAVAGCCEGPLLGATLRIRAAHAPPGVRTQVFTTAAGLKISAGAAGAALAGLLSQLPGAVLLLGVAAVHLLSGGLLRLLGQSSDRQDSHVHANRQTP